MPNPFVETRFDPGIIPRGTGGLTYKTTVLRTGADLEQRICTRPEYLFEGDIGEVLLDANQVAYINAFFNARRGMVEGFRYKYWGDYRCTATPLQLGPATFTQGVTYPAVPNGTNTTFQLLKRYTDAGDVTYKTIIKPVAETIQLYVGNRLIPVNDYVLDSGTGIVVFNPTPLYIYDNVTGFRNSYPLTWLGEFDLPVWFNVDSLPGIQLYHSDGTKVFGSKAGELFRFETLPIVELPLESESFSLGTRAAVWNCGLSLSSRGTYSWPNPEVFIVNLSPAIGTVSVEYDAYNAADRFVVEYAGRTVIDTGFRGDPIYSNPRLAAMGLPPVEGPGYGAATFFKASPSPMFALVKIYWPPWSAAWDCKVNCPQ